MSVQSYDESVAQNVHSDVQSTIQGLEGSLTELGGFVNTVKSSWDGDEMEQYGQIQANWDKCAGTVREILSQVHQALGTNTESVVTMRGRVKGALSGS